MDPRFDHLNLNHMNLLTSQGCVPTLGHPQMQPTLTQLVRWGIENDNNDYVLDTGHARIQDHAINWHEQEPLPKSDIISQTAKEFLEQNDMVPVSQHIPQESMTYLVEDDNSFIKLGHVTHDHNVDVIGEAFAGAIPKPGERSSGGFHGAILPTNAFVNSTNPFAATMEVDVTGGQRTIFPTQNHVNLMTDHRISLQRLLGLGSHHHDHLQLQMQQARPVFNNPARPNILSPFISNHPQVFSPHLASTFQNYKFHVNKFKKQKPSPRTGQDTSGLKRKYVKRMSNEEQILKGNNLWQFLMRLLGSRKDLVTWTGHDLEFKILNKEEIAKMWGTIKNREKMNFDKFSRALRYYYNKRILIHNPQCRLTYCFMRNPKDPVFSAMLLQAMRTIPTDYVCNAMCDNPGHPHEIQYSKRKVRSGGKGVSLATGTPDDNKYTNWLETGLCRATSVANNIVI